MTVAIAPTVPQPATVAIYGRDIAPAVGDLILIGEWRLGVLLQPGDAPVDSGYRGCMFRVPTNSGGPIQSLAIDVTVTGRTLQRRPYQDGLWVRVRVTFVGDCEPDSHTSGWLRVP